MIQKIGWGVLIRAGVLSLFVVGYIGLMRAQALDPWYVPAQGTQPSVNGLEVKKLKENFYVIMGGGGNTSVFITSKGVVLVDSKSPGWGKPLLEKIKTITEKPVIAVINTHFHGDHTSGNIDMPPGVEIVDQEVTKKNMMETDFFKQPENARGLPTKTFKNKTSLFSGADRVDVYCFGPTETGGDTWVAFPAIHTMASGDAFPRLAVTILSTRGGGDPLKAPDTLAKVVANIKDVDTIVTGHDGIRRWDELKGFVQFRREFLAFVLAERKAGKTPDQVTADYKVPDKYISQGYERADPRLIKAHVQGIYDELDKK